MASSMTEEARSEMEVLKEDLAKLRRDMGDVVSSLKEIGRHRVHDVKDKAQAELDHRLDQLGHAYDAVRREGSRAAETVSHTIEDRPLASIAVAFAAGLLLSRLLSSSSEQ